MDRAWANAANKLDFRDPMHFLKALRLLEPTVAASQFPSGVKSLRTNALKQWRELREAALFCYEMGQRIGQTVYLAKSESQDYDFVASWVVDNVRHLAPVQLKEVVPPNINPAASLSSVIESLSKYVDSRQLTVAIHLNQQMRFDPETVSIPALRIAALWVFGSITEDESEWVLWGNFLEKPQGLRFAYPV